MVLPQQKQQYYHQKQKQSSKCLQTLLQIRILKVRLILIFPIIIILLYSYLLYDYHVVGGVKENSTRSSSSSSSSLPSSTIIISCNVDQLKETIQSKKFHKGKLLRNSSYEKATLKDVVALAKAELLLKDPYLSRDMYPKLLTACENKLLSESSSSKSKFDNAVIKQVYLEEFLPLAIPEDVTHIFLHKKKSSWLSLSSSTNTRINNNNNNKATIIDIGANIGQFAIPLAKDGHVVYSFEPVLDTCNKLKDNVKKEHLSNNIKVNCFGVGDKDEVLSFGYTGDDKKNVPSASYKIVDPNHPSAHVMNTVRTTPVHNVLDDNVLNSIHLFKTDTQGNEEAVIRGSKELLSRKNPPRFVIIEFSYYLLTKSGSSVTKDPRTILELMYEYGYVCTHMVYHHITAPPPINNYNTVDTPSFMKDDGNSNSNSTTTTAGSSITVTFDDMVRSISDKHKSWSHKNGQMLVDKIQGMSGWTDLLCFA